MKKYCAEGSKFNQIVIASLSKFIFIKYFILYVSTIL